MDTGLIGYYAMRARLLADLEALSTIVVDAEYPRLKQHPNYWRLKKGTSGCYGIGDIFMHPRQYCHASMLHELTHAMGYNYHTSGFVRWYIRLLVKYGRCEEGPLITSAGLYGVL